MSGSQDDVVKPNGLGPKSVLAGCESEVNYLIYRRDHPRDGKLVVYVDHELDLDWECDDKAGKVVDTAPLSHSVRKILNGIAAIEPIAHSWPKDLKLTSKRLLGEALASVLRDDFEGAEIALDNAKRFVRAKSKQVSRYWTLQGCFAFGGMAALAGLTEIVFRSSILESIGRTPFLLSLCFWAGCVGALLFVVMRFGSQPKVDSTAEKHLHYLESLARIVGGGVAGVLIGGMVKLGLILPVFDQAGMEALAMCITAMIAGASERLAAGVITKAENGEITKQEEGQTND